MTSTNAMSVDVFPYDARFLDRTATRILKEIKGMMRVADCCTSKPPARWIGDSQPENLLIRLLKT